MKARLASERSWSRQWIASSRWTMRAASLIGIQQRKKLLDTRRSETIGKEMAALIIPERFREQHRKGLARYLATGKGRVIGQRLELSAERSDGTEFPIELTITRIESKGAPMFTGYLRDITERKRAENRLSAQYTVTRALAESNTIGEGASKNPSGRFVKVWDGSMDRFGQSIAGRMSCVALRPGKVWALKRTNSRVLTVGRFSRPESDFPDRVWNDGANPCGLLTWLKTPNFPRSAAAAKARFARRLCFPDKVSLGNPGCSGILQPLNSRT